MKKKLSETNCFYCDTIIDRLKTKKRFFCSDECRRKYWRGVYKGLWKEGAHPIDSEDKPNNQKAKGGKSK